VEHSYSHHPHSFSVLLTQNLPCEKFGVEKKKHRPRRACSDSNGKEMTNSPKSLQPQRGGLDKKISESFEKKNLLPEKANSQKPEIT